MALWIVAPHSTHPNANTVDLKMAPRRAKNVWITRWTSKRNQYTNCQVAEIVLNNASILLWIQSIVPRGCSTIQITFRQDATMMRQAQRAAIRLPSLTKANDSFPAGSKTVRPEVWRHLCWKKIDPISLKNNSAHTTEQRNPNQAA